MGQLAIAGKTVEVNEEGYFTDPNQWDEEVAREMARQLNITLTDKHFSVINYLRDKHQEGIPLSIRRVSKSGVCDIKTFYQLFPGGPLKVSSKIAGIPKPASCV